MMEQGPKVFEVEKSDLSHARIHTLPESNLQEGEVRLLIDDFALTANNITYAAFGEAMKYWSFFPSDEAGWGRIPVWGFATVNESLNEDIVPGERYYGYFPMATELIVRPDDVRDSGFVDGSAHRQGLPPFYNLYTRIGSDPAYKADYESQQMLFRPLFMTSFLIDDQLAEFDFHGAEQVLLSSASSKTALALAWLLKKRGMKVVALTSQRSRAFVKNSGTYDQIVLYDDIEESVADCPSVFVDFAGDPKTIAAVHTKLGDKLKASIRVGATNWQAGMNAGTAEAAPLPGPEPVFFFAPDQGKKRMEEWGAKAFSERTTGEMVAFYEPASRWIKTVRGLGDEAIHECYDRVLQGEALPSEGFILSFGL